MGGLLKRYRELIVVAFLLVAPLGLYFAHAKHPSERSRLDRTLLWISAPIEKGTEWMVVKALDIWHGYVALRHSHERAVALQRAVGELELDRLELQRVRLENERLRLLLGFADESAKRELVGARVIGVRLDPKGLQLVTIDQGSDGGVEPMMPVVIGAGVVGRVHAVTGPTADVLLMTDRNSSVAVLVERTRARANVRGTGSPDSCRLEYALRSDDMSEGDVLVTSGTDGVFPRGLPVGTLVNLKRSGQGLYQKAEVKPSVDVTKLEEVLVITSFDRRPEPPPPVAESPRPAAGTKPAAEARTPPVTQPAKATKPVAEARTAPATQTAKKSKPGADAREAPVTQATKPAEP